MFKKRARLQACRATPSTAIRPLGPLARMLLRLPAVYRDRPEPHGLRRTPADSMPVRKRGRTGLSGPRGTPRVANRAASYTPHWFDSGSGHAFRVALIGLTESRSCSDLERRQSKPHQLANSLVSSDGLGPKSLDERTRHSRLHRRHDVQPQGAALDRDLEAVKGRFPRSAAIRSIISR